MRQKAEQLVTLFCFLFDLQANVFLNTLSKETPEERDMQDVYCAVLSSWLDERWISVGRWSRGGGCVWVSGMWEAGFPSIPRT